MTNITHHFLFLSEQPPSNFLTKMKLIISTIDVVPSADNKEQEELAVAALRKAFQRKDSSLCISSGYNDNVGN